MVKNVHKAFALIVNLWDTTKSEKAFEWLKHMHVEAPVQFKDKIKRHHV